MPKIYNRIPALNCKKASKKRIYNTEFGTAICLIFNTDLIAPKYTVILHHHHTWLTFIFTDRYIISNNP